MSDWPAKLGPPPRYWTRRTPERPTYGPAVGRIAEILGTPLFPAQQYQFDVALEVQSEEAGDPMPGEWAYEEVWDFEPRRAGKTFKIGPLVGHRCGSTRGRQAWLTAQKRLNAVARWDAVVQQLKRSAQMRSQFHDTAGVGNERVAWRETGSIFRPFAPRRDAMHGEDPDLVIVDELWSFSLADKKAIEQGYKPAWSVKSGQAWLLSAAGDQTSAWLNGAREQGAVYAGEGRRLGVCVFDWSIPDEVGGVPVEELPDDQLLDVVLDCHPRRDNGLRVPFLAEELKGGRAAFLRAYGNKTDMGDGQKLVIAPDALRRATSMTSRIPAEARIALGLDVDPDRREAAVSAAWRDPISGTAHTEVVKVAPGTRWLAKYVHDVVIRQNPGAVVVNNAGPARDIADELERMGVDLLRLPAGDYAAACARLGDEIEAPIPTVAIRGEKDLLDAVHAAARRRLSGGAAWDRRGEDPITTLVAHTLALWGADHMTAAVPRFRIA